MGFSGSSVSTIVLLALLYSRWHAGTYRRLTACKCMFFYSSWRATDNFRTFLEARGRLQRRRPNSSHKFSIRLRTGDRNGHLPTDALQLQVVSGYHRNVNGRCCTVDKRYCYVYVVIVVPVRSSIMLDSCKCLLRWSGDPMELTTSDSFGRRCYSSVS